MINPRFLKITVYPDGTKRKKPKKKSDIPTSESKEQIDKCLNCPLTDCNGSLKQCEKRMAKMKKKEEDNEC